MFCKELEDRFTQALSEVCIISFFSDELREFKYTPYLGTLESPSLFLEIYEE